MKTTIKAWMAPIHCIAGRRAYAEPDGVQIVSRFARKKVIPYEQVKQCCIQPTHETIQVSREKSDIKFHRVILLSEKIYVMEMTEHESDAFVRHLKKYAPSLAIDFRTKKRKSISFLPK